MKKIKLVKSTVSVDVLADKKLKATIEGSKPKVLKDANYLTDDLPIN